MASNPMQQFSVHKIGPEIKIAGVDLSFTKKGNIINLLTMEAKVTEILFVRAPKYEYHPINITKIPKNCKNPSSLPYSSGNKPSLTNVFD